MAAERNHEDQALDGEAGADAGLAHKARMRELKADVDQRMRAAQRDAGILELMKGDGGASPLVSDVFLAPIGGFALLAGWLSLCTHSKAK